MEKSASNLLVNQEWGMTEGRVPRFGKSKIQRCKYLEDRISHLPDEILLLVLSHLDIQQQAKTSILARRWKNLWKYATSLCLVFQDDGLGFPKDEQLYNTRSRGFVNCVDRILELLCPTSIIDDFTIMFCFSGKNYQQVIDGWLRFALQKRVKRLKLDFICPWAEPNTYCLTTEVIRNYKVDSLTSLSLQCLDVSGDFLEYLLSVSPFLEELSVSDSTALVNFTVTGQSLKLKHLEISCCLKLEHLDIHDVNLVSFEYYGNSKCVAIKNTPCLVKAHFTWFLLEKDTENTVQILRLIPLLETLTVAATTVMKLTSFPKIPTLRSLKHLELLLRPNNFCGLLFAHLLEASPFLTEIKVVFRFFKDSSQEKAVERLERQHRGLKVVELIGYIGCKLDLAIALYAIENVATLEKMIVDTNHPYTTKPYRTRLIGPYEQDTARARAREQLLERLPSGVQLVVI